MNPRYAPRTPPPAPEPPKTERSTPRIPRAGDYAPVEGSAAFRNDPEYQGRAGDSPRASRLNWALDRVRAADAYARLAEGAVPGAGIRISVVDDGVDTGHPELKPAFDTGRLTATGISGGRADPMLGKESHGTAVTSLILAHKHTADRRSMSFHGIAYGATVDVYGIPVGTPTNAYDPRPAADLEDSMRRVAQRQVQYLRKATENHPDIVNMSFERVIMAEQYLDAEIRGDVERGLATLLDFVKGARGTIFVHAAGNGNGRECAERSYVGCASGRLAATSPAFDAALPLWDRSGEVGKRWVAVVATDRDNAIADFSNHCGHAARWCLAAPGEDLLLANTPTRRSRNQTPVANLGARASRPPAWHHPRNPLKGQGFPHHSPGRYPT